MFSYTGLTPEQVDIMQADGHVYILKTRRISIAGCKFSFLPRRSSLVYFIDILLETTTNVVHVAKAMDAAVRKSYK